ncbi:MAG: SCO family protein [Pikeienuella sp.]
MLKPILAIAAATTALVLAAAIYLLMLGPSAPVSAPSGARLDIGGADIGGPFELTSETGARVSSASLIDRPALIYFGYTFCPDVCPLDTQVLADATRILAADGIEVLPVFVTLDPARDNAEILKQFTDALHPQMVGLTGSEAEIRAVADAYKVYFEKVDMPDSAMGYLINHTAFTYLAGPSGLQAMFRNGYPAEVIAEEVAAVLATAD